MYKVLGTFILRILFVVPFILINLNAEMKQEIGFPTPIRTKKTSVETQKMCLHCVIVCQLDSVNDRLRIFYSSFLSPSDFFDLLLGPFIFTLFIIKLTYKKNAQPTFFCIFFSLHKFFCCINF